MSIIKDENLKFVPFLILFDRSNSKMLEFTEKFRFELNTMIKEKNIDILYNIQYVDFSIKSEEILLGVDWLCDVMKAI